MLLRHAPARVATGAFVLHSGWSKLNVDEETAAGLHGMAVGTYPFLAKVPAARFAKALAIGEIAVGAALLIPFVSSRIAGSALAGFGAALMGLYLRTPGMRKPGSVWPTDQGTALAKDVWLLGTGLTLAGTSKH